MINPNRRSQQSNKSALRKSSPSRSKVSERRVQNLGEAMREDPAYFNDQLYCKNCNKDTRCVISRRGGNRAWFFCSIFSLCGGLCLLPFVCDVCLDTEIQCLDCGELKKVEPAQWLR